MSQEVRLINVKDLVLWTENPRDPIKTSAEAQDVVDRAVSDPVHKWNLLKLAKEMGEFYDFSELPTVVVKGDVPVVYDGNRRVILAKISLGYVNGGDVGRVALPDVPPSIPCNVCSEEVALKSIFRKHSESGSWDPLERDIFANKYLNKPKSPFLLIEEATGMISSNAHLNQRFVRDEIFNEESLRRLGFAVSDVGVKSKCPANLAATILEDLSQKIRDKVITTRKRRGEVVEVLEPASQKILDEYKDAGYSDFRNPGSPGNIPAQGSARQTKRTKPKDQEIFGGKLYLKVGEVSDLYRDIADLYDFYVSKKKNLSKTFPSVVRMSLRLLCECAAKSEGKQMDGYLKGWFSLAKGQLDKDDKTTLSNNNVSEGAIVQLLHTGAHNYSAASNIDQTLALSLIIGKILTLSHGKGA